MQHAVINTLYTAQACPVAEGLFVPLHVLKSQGIKAATAIRALSEVSMLIRSTQHQMPTHTREVDGHTTTGVILDPRFIAGLTPMTAVQAGS